MDYLISFFGDLHVGNFYSDIPGFLEMNKLLIDSYKPEKYVIVLVGDMIEGANKYRTQIYKMFNIEPLRVQLDYFHSIILELKKYGEEKDVFVEVNMVLGNHDLGYDYGNLLKFIPGINYAHDVLVLNTDYHKIICKHQLNRMSRGSYLTWWTGYLLDLAYRVLEEYGGDILVTAHTHRPDIGIMHKGKKLFIGLPSFVSSNEDHLYNKALLYYKGWIQIYTSPKNDPYKIREYNIEYMRKIIESTEPVKEVYVE